MATAAVGTLGVATSASAAAAATTPKIAHLVASPATVTTKNGSVTLSATVTNASTCTFASTKPVAGLPDSPSCSTTSASPVSVTVVLPAATTATTYAITLTAQGTSATKTKTIDVTVDAGAGQPTLGGATALASTYYGYCAIVTTASVTGGVDCWAGLSGQSGDGSTTVSLTAVPVRSPLPGNVGLLTGVTGIVGAGTEYCAVYSSAGNVACWGSDQSGSNVFYPVTVQGPSGALSSIASVVGTVADTDTFCGLTTPQASNGREVWCWGSNYTSYTFGDGSTNSNATWNTASQVVNTADSGPMTQVSALFSGGNTALCAIVGSAANLDCWGQNEYGQLGNDTSSPIDYPVAVHGVNNSGLLSGVTGANGYGFTWCATYSGSSDAACWGFNSDANFGNGTQGGTSDFPLAVSAPAGESGSLAGVTHLGTDDLGSCAVLTSGGVDCWGFANYGVLGNGSDTNGSAIPAPVLGVGDEGTLGGVASMTGSSVTDRDSYCAVLTSKEAVCWGLGDAGELGSGGATLPICNDGLPCSTLPVAVVGTSGTGHLKKIKSILGVPVQAPRFGGSYCALLTTKKVDCWGGAPEGELGNGTTSSSPVPGPVFTAS